jgi:glucokinase
MQIMGKKYAIGIDLGGSKIYTILADQGGRILAQTKLPTEREKGKKRILENIFLSVEKVLSQSKIKKEKLKGIGIGIPGTVEQGKGFARRLPNLASLENVDIRQALQKRFKLNVFVENDANLAALAENFFGAGKKARQFIYLTISTGIGGGLIIDKKLYHGKNGAAGEVGHMMIKKNGPLCGCGQRGCLEALASGSAIKNLFGISAKQLQEKVERKEKKARIILENVIDDLAIGLANLVNILNPELIILGGGLSKFGNLLFPLLIKKVKKYSLSLNSRDLKIVPARLGERSGAIGAVCLCFFRGGRKC